MLRAAVQWVRRNPGRSKAILGTPTGFVCARSSFSEPEGGWLGGLTKNYESLSQNLTKGSEKLFDFDLDKSDVLKEIKESTQNLSASLGLSSSAALAMKLQATMNTVLEQLGEAPLPIERAIPAFKTLASSYDLKHFADAVRGMGARPADPGELDDLCEYLPLADAAYLNQEDLEAKLQQLGWHLLYHDAVTKAGERTAHYVAFDTKRRKVVVAVKGTSSINDVITDCVCTPVQLSRSGAIPGVSHQAMTDAAYYLLERLGFVLKDLFEAQKFEVVVVGHSLGAGTGALLAMLLKSELGMKNVRGIGYASPPVVDKATALASAEFITCVSHQTDLITVSSVANLERFGRVLTGLDNALEQGPVSVGDCHELVVASQTSHEANPGDMYLPGKVVYVSHDGKEEGSRKYSGVVKDGTLGVLNNINLSPTMIEDHFMDSYMHALQQARAACQR